MDRSSPVVRARAHPVRTCVGCRRRSPKSDLLRLVVAGDPPERVVAPDPRGTAPGRGAHLHPAVACLDQAVRRRALTRALRAEGPLDLSALRAYVERQHTHNAASPDVDREKAEQQLMNRR